MKSIFSLFVCASALLITSCAHAISVQVVQSIPEHTALEQSDLPFAKDVWIEMIDGAKKTIELEQMYVYSEAGQAMEPVLQALERAGKRGIKIRVILWKGMVQNDTPSYERLKNMPNTEVRLIDMKAITGGILHAKFWVIDGEKLFVGSQNADWKALTQIHETGTLIDNADMAKSLRSIFEIDWKICETGKMPSAADLAAHDGAAKVDDVELVASPQSLNPAGIRPAIDALLELMNNAKKTIRITVMDYSTYPFGSGAQWFELDNALKAAAARGVKIQMLVSHWNTEKPEINSIKKLSQVPGIDLRIVTIPQLASGHIPYARVLHSKTMVVDESIYWVGTSNWSKGYFADTRNIEVIMKRPALAETGLRIFNALWNQSYTAPVDPNKDYPKPIKGVK